MNTVALELVPPNLDRGEGAAVAEAQKVARLSVECGIGERLGHVMIPAMIAEDGDRPIEMKPKMDVLPYWSILRPELPVCGLCTQAGFDGDLSDLNQDPMTGIITDAKTGEVVPWPFFGRGSKIQIGDRFLILGERGTVALAKINPKKYEELGRTSYEGIRHPAWTAPVLSRGLLYLRSENTLLCLDVRPKAE